MPDEPDKKTTRKPTAKRRKPYVLPKEPALP